MSTDTYIGLRTLMLVCGHLYWSTDTYWSADTDIGLRTLTFVYEHLYWSPDTDIGLQTFTLSTDIGNINRPTTTTPGRKVTIHEIFAFNVCHCNCS